MIVVRRTPEKILANFDAFHWIGRKALHFVERELEKDFRNPRYQTDPRFREFTDKTWEGAQKARVDPNHLRKVGMRISAGLGATTLGLGAIGAGAYFLRRRKTKNGKTIVERVRK